MRSTANPPLLVFLALWLPAAASAQHAAAMQDHWRVVREVWTELFAENASIRLKPDVDGQTLHEAMAGQAERLSENGSSTVISITPNASVKPKAGLSA